MPILHILYIITVLNNGTFLHISFFLHAAASNMVNFLGSSNKTIYSGSSHSSNEINKSDETQLSNENNESYYVFNESQKPNNSTKYNGYPNN